MSTTFHIKASSERTNFQYPGLIIFSPMPLTQLEVRAKHKYKNAAFNSFTLFETVKCPVNRPVNMYCT